MPQPWAAGLPHKPGLDSGAGSSRTQAFQRKRRLWRVGGGCPGQPWGRRSILAETVDAKDNSPRVRNSLIWLGAGSIDKEGSLPWLHWSFCSHFSPSEHPFQTSCRESPVWGNFAAWISRAYPSPSCRNDTPYRSVSPPNFSPSTRASRKTCGSKTHGDSEETSRSSEIGAGASAWCSGWGMQGGIRARRTTPWPC